LERVAALLSEGLQQFDVVALVADGFHPLRSAQGGALRVVGDELRLGQTLLVDLGVDEEHGDVCSDSPLDRADRTAGVGRVEMIATDLLVIAVSINLLSVFVSPFEASTVAL
jgi:hypothetical protein